MTRLPALFGVLVGLILPVPRVACQPGATAPFVLRVSPPRVSAPFRYPVYLRVTLENVTAKDRFIRHYLWPVAFGGAKTDLYGLMMRCYDVRTRQEVRYTWPPPGKTYDDARGRESAQRVPAGGSVAAVIDLFRFCRLPPGDYAVLMQYDTSFVPDWIRPNERAWHGRTNKVETRVHISAPVLGRVRAG